MGILYLTPLYKKFEILKHESLPIPGFKNSIVLLHIDLRRDTPNLNKLYFTEK